MTARLLGRDLVAVEGRREAVILRVDRRVSVDLFWRLSALILEREYRLICLTNPEPDPNP